MTKIPRWINSIDHRLYTGSPIWRAKRIPILERANGNCERCGNPSKRLQVHHKTYVRWGGDELLTDLEALCARCHMAHHGIGKAKKIKMGPRPPKGFSRIRKRLERQKKKGTGVWSNWKKDAMAATMVKGGGKLIDPTNWTPPNRSKRK